MVDYIVIGAGITGIVLCKMLKKKKTSSVLILEAEKEPGGLCRTRRINGHFLDIGGGHFFGTKHDAIYDFVFSHISEKNFNVFKRVSKQLIGEATIDYPIESNLWQLPINEQINYIISIIRNGEALEKPEPNNFEEWIRWKLGDRICDTYMLPYNKKLWGINPSEMDIDWLHKIPKLSIEKILRNTLEKKQDTTIFPAHETFYYPKEGGFQTIFNSICEDERSNIVCNEKVQQIIQSNDGCWVINGKYKTKNIINTAPWNDLFVPLGQPHELKEDFSKICYNKLSVSLHEAHYSHDWHWRYIPDEQCIHHREFYINNFSPKSKKTGVFLESNFTRFKDTIEFENMPAIYWKTTSAAYPIPVVGHAAAINNILAYYNKYNIYGVGRWGQHQYQNADISIYNAIEFVDSL